jgi:hypothetical protein
MERWGSLWLLELTPSGNIVVATVFPMYAEGTDKFVVLEARHSTTGVIFLGQTYGPCLPAIFHYHLHDRRQTQLLRRQPSRLTIHLKFDST